jgi:GrpB-like predicted nucleotidyltransferase (UPF0157 family)
MLRALEPDVNLHVSAVGCSGAERTARFRDHLRGRGGSGAYVATKRELASRVWAYAQNYADAKTGVIEQILGPR